MELRVFDKTVQPLGAIDELASLLWHTKYFDVGTFSLLAPITDNNSRLLVEGNLITKHDGKKEVKTADGGVWRRAAQITYVHITKDENGLEQLEAQGYMLSWWLNKRCIYPQIVATGTNQYLINLMVKNNCGSAAGTKRRFPLLTFLAQETIDGVAVEYANEVYAQLGQEVKARAQAGKLGYDILLNERERLFGFYLYKGNDLTATNTEGNTPCIFSRDFDNVNEQEYTASIENCGNFIYVQGAADDDGSQPVTTVDGEGATGLDLVEVFCDATDIARKYQQGETEVTIPLNTYIAMLKTRGGAELENYGKNINFVSTINTNSNLKFKADFDLGDRITCKETKWGIQIDARITEVGKGVTRIQTQNITDQRFNSAVCGIVTGTVEEIDASVLTKQFTDFFNTYSAAVLDEFSAYKQSMEKYLTEIAGVYDSYVSKTEGLFAQYESQFNERYSSFESTLNNWDNELLSAYTDFMAKIKLFQSDAENEFNTWFESIKDKLGEDIAGSLQLQIEELAAAMQEVKKQAEAGTVDVLEQKAGVA